MIATVAVAPEAIVPSAQVTVAVPEQVPWQGVAEANVTPAGSVSVTVDALAESGPALATVRV